MGRFSKGMLGPVSGTVGPVVGASWKEVTYIRSRPTIKKKRRSSEKQVNARLKFALVVTFVNEMLELIDITFKNFSVNMSASNAAVSYNYGNAVAGIAPDFTIDYAKALVSRGKLPNVTEPAATQTNMEVFFTWLDNSQVTDAAPTDLAVLVAYCPVLKQSIYTVGTAMRSEGSANLNVASFKGYAIETWIAFLSADEMQVASDSFFTGELTVG